jgi:hypothetical protein
VLLSRNAFSQQAGAPPADKDNIHYPMRKLQPDEAAFFNSDHSPVGAHVSLVYGMEASRGLTMLDVRRIRGLPLMVQDGILVAVKNGPFAKAQVMPLWTRSGILRSDDMAARLIIRLLNRRRSPIL